MTGGWTEWHSSTYYYGDEIKEREIGGACIALSNEK
jgi:hypothetical protein